MGDGRWEMGDGSKEYGVRSTEFSGVEYFYFQILQLDKTRIEAILGM
jgi:hypothetical protein